MGLGISWRVILFGTENIYIQNVLPMILQSSLYRFFFHSLVFSFLHSVSIPTNTYKILAIMNETSHHCLMFVTILLLPYISNCLQPVLTTLCWLCYVHWLIWKVNKNLKGPILTKIKIIKMTQDLERYTHPCKIHSHTAPLSSIIPFSQNLDSVLHTSDSTAAVDLNSNCSTNTIVQIISCSFVTKLGG